MNFKSWCTVIFLVGSLELSYSQCNSIDFELPVNSCLDQKIKLVSTSNLANYSWDLCSGDFDSTPNVSVFSANAGSAFNVKIVEQYSLYYGFYLSRSHQKLFRLDFGDDVDNTPTQIDLGGLGINSSGWLTIDIIYENGIYYALAIDFYNKIYRLNFGTSITNIPSNAEIIYQDGLLSNPIDLVLNEDETGKFAFIANYSNNKLLTLSFGSSFGISPNSILKNEIPISGSGNLSGLSFIRDCNIWYLMATSHTGGQINKIAFNTGLNDASPSISPITGLSFTPTNPAGVALVFENNKYYAFIQTQSAQSKLYKIDFGNSMANGVMASTDFGNFGVLSNIWGFSMFKAKSDWIVLSSENTGANIYRIAFANNCFSSQEYSKASKVDATIVSPGTYSISLTTKNVDGYFESVSKAMTVSTDVSPDIQFNSQNVCVSNPISFTSENFSGNLANYSWSFGDGGISMQQNPSHLYGNTGEFLVGLEVMADNGCTNSIEKEIEIYDKPIASFTLPSGLVCTNNEFTFVNNTIDNFNGHLTYEWLVNGEVQSNSRDLKYSFSSVGDHQIALKSNIPGCSDEISMVLSNVQTGPNVDFSFEGKCVGETILFSNQSLGDINSLVWDFGNGLSSTEESPSQVYSTFGNYVVSLNIIGNNGCISALSRPLNIYSNPQPNFFIDLPPFSCSGTPTQFHDNTPVMFDSNIASWLWSFNDGSGITATSKDPTYTYSQAGVYSVSLQIETNYGCSASIELPIIISTSPTADFTVGPSCLNKLTTFTNTSSTGIQTSNWIINGNPFPTTNASYTFSNVGTYSTSLTVKGSNQCENTKVKPIEVKPVPTLDFNSTAICATKETTFSDNTSGNDLPTSWTWNFGSGNTSTGSSATYSFPSVGSFPVMMSVVTQAGCNYNFSKNVTVATPPIASFTATTSFGPPPLLVQFNSSSANASSLLWNFNDAASNSSTIPNPLFTFNELGEYNVALTAFNSIGCSDTFSKTINVLIPNIDLSLDVLKVQTNNITHSISPVVTITNKSNVPISNVGILINSSSGTRIATTIQTNLLTGSSGEYVVPLELRSSDEYFCAELSVVEDYDIMNNAKCINLSDRSIIVKPYPNPSSGIVVFEAVLPEAGSGSLQILDSKGKMIFKNNFPNLIAGMNQLQLDLSSTEPGLYLAIWVINGQKAEVKFLMQ